MKKVSTYTLLCDTMLKKSNIKRERINELTDMLEISRIEVESILANRASSDEQGCLIAGPPEYLSAMYGAVSIKDF